MMRDSPRVRRLRSDWRAINQLREESSIFEFDTPETSHGSPPESYLLYFRGSGLWRPLGAKEILVRQQHEVRVRLGASYPRMMPELTWRSPIFHPNISSGGVVCLGGYGTYWVPSLSLAELCLMLWDMIRYKNYDVESPYNRDAALWARSQTQFVLPLDNRPLRDRLATNGHRHDAHASLGQPALQRSKPEVAVASSPVMEAELVEPAADPDILFID